MSSMASPPKPWERASPNSPLPSAITAPATSASSPVNSVPFAPMEVVPMMQQHPPPLGMIQQQQQQMMTQGPPPMLMEMEKRLHFVSHMSQLMHGCLGALHMSADAVYRLFGNGAALLEHVGGAASFLALIRAISTLYRRILAAALRAFGRGDHADAIAMSRAWTGHSQPGNTSSQGPGWIPRAFAATILVWLLKRVLFPAPRTGHPTATTSSTTIPMQQPQHNSQYPPGEQYNGFHGGNGVGVGSSYGAAPIGNSFGSSSYGSGFGSSYGGYGSPSYGGYGSSSYSGGYGSSYGGGYGSSYGAGYGSYGGSYGSGPMGGRFNSYYGGGF